MKIYNEVITQFNDLTGQWETIYEDSFDYNGLMALAQSLPSNATAINTSDTIADTIKTTTGYFTNGDGTLSGTDIHTGSLAASNEDYYFNAVQVHPDSSSAEVQFSVAFAHADGSGSDTYGDSNNNKNTLIGQTQALYRQLSSILLAETEISGGFKISAAGSSPTRAVASATARDDYIYLLVGKRDKFKDRINKKAWTLVLSGSAGDNAGDGIRQLSLTDDSTTVAGEATPGGPRHSIISGALGVVHNAATSQSFGWFYPEMGIMIFSGAELSASIPGTTAGTDMTASFSSTAAGTAARNNSISCSGFAPNLNAKKNSRNALRFINCMQAVGSSTSLRLRSEEDQTQENYFCRIRAEEYNFTANPTFVSGSKNKIRNMDMHGNPQTFITGVGLYNSAGQLLAIAKLSSPLKKNFASEATVKVKLTY